MYTGRPWPMPEVGLAGLGLDIPHSGTAVYTRNLVPRLAAAAPDLSFCLFTRRSSWRDARLPAKRVSTPFERLDQTRPAWARADKLAWETIALPLASAARRESILHMLHFAAPPVHHGRLVVTVHDVIPLVLPGYHRGPASKIYSRLMARLVRRADAIIAVSHHARSEIVKTLRVDEARVFVTYEGADERFHPHESPEESEALRHQYGLPERFFLYLGSAEKRKNLEILVRAWARAQKELGSMNTRLVVVARFPPPDALYPDIPLLARELGLADEILFVPEVAEEDKPALYRASLAFCMPSRYEGFGLPVVEAMASGSPVLASSATSLAEVVGEGGRLLSPDHVGLWADAICDVAASERAREALIARGLKQASRFSWDQTAKDTVGVYRQVLAL
jgi:glycosyltransferase involved in cell wall biosynthesis